MRYARESAPKPGAECDPARAGAGPRRASEAARGAHARSGGRGAGPARPRDVRAPRGGRYRVGS